MRTPIGNGLLHAYHRRIGRQGLPDCFRARARDVELQPFPRLLMAPSECLCTLAQQLSRLPDGINFRRSEVPSPTQPK